MSNNKPNVAYFCMEYALESDFKQYAGGLGILAGDYLKGAKQYDFPVIGIGILWKQGYSDQMVGKDGTPYDTYHNYKYDFLEDTGVTVTVQIQGEDVACKVWKTTEHGNNPIYLLDTDIPGNPHAWTTGQLYGWFGEERVAQEIVLGIGGVRALRALGIDVDVYHFNEGHALFAGFELLREEMENNGLSYEEAFEVVKNKTVFTTHTPVIQGNESHPISRLTYMGANLHLTEQQLEELGGSPFNMTVGALRVSKKSNAVAQLHGETANKMWEHVEGRSEIVGITNAIHQPTWVDSNMLEAAESGADVWEPHMENKRGLIKFVEERNGVKLDENKLIIGFSRRAVPYKRSDLIFQNAEIAEEIFGTGKVQIVFSGRAHPLDDNGKQIVKNLVDWSKKYPNSVVFLENYDMTIGAWLTRGSDVWLNNPRRPKEASGTSGMKASMNGVLNFSVLDGWWPEACKHGENGWQIGNAFESEDVVAQDNNDRTSLFDVLLNEVIPTYYDNKDKWKQMMRNSIMDTKDQFNVKRMLEEYYELLYKA
jgi:starch phosphorylase